MAIPTGGRGRGISGSGRGRGHDGRTGKARAPGGIDEFKEKSTPAARAQALFEQQQQLAQAQRRRNANAAKAVSQAVAKHETVQKSAALLSSSVESLPQLPPATLIKALTPTLEIRKAISLTKALIKQKRASLEALADMNKLTLSDFVRWPACDPDMKGKVGEQEIAKAIVACHEAAEKLDSELGPPQAGPSTSTSSSSTQSKGYSWEGKREADDLESFLKSHSPSSKKRKVSQADERLSREFGNPLLPLDAQGDPTFPHSIARKQGNGGSDEEEEEDEKALPEYEIPAILDEQSLKGRTAMVNRAPVMTVWTTILLERMGFQRREALSLAQCYVSTTSTARAVTLGLTSQAERDKASSVGPKQPHFVLMGVKLPVLQLRQRTASGNVGEYRAIYDGQVVEPQKAFDYIFRSFYQTLPYVFGTLVLLADSYIDPSDTDADELHAVAWDLYCEFRPETGGEWGKRAKFSCDTALGLRKGMPRMRGLMGKSGGDDDDDNGGKGKGKQDAEGLEGGVSQKTSTASAKPKTEKTKDEMMRDHQADASGPSTASQTSTPSSTVAVKTEGTEE
ncbi:hypothetical protein OC861_003735 [Tilletia horrida]|nr:hypothetical protein OC861_003735 [Tilletia horrida]